MKYVRNLSEQIKANFKERLKNYDWTSIMLELNLERAFSSFSSLLEIIFEEIFPFKKSKPNRNKSPIKPLIYSSLAEFQESERKANKEKKNMNPTLINIAYNAVYRSSKKSQMYIFSR